MINVSTVIKNIEFNINDLFVAMFGSYMDEYSKKYSEVYVYELNGLYSNIGFNLNTLQSLNIPISYLELRNSILTNWSMGTEYVDCKMLDEYCNKILLNSLKEEEYNLPKIELPNNLSEEFLKFIIDSVGGAVKSTERLLIENCVDRSCFLKDLKEKDNDRYNKIINELKKEYIIGQNTLYTLTGKSPESNSLHNSIVENYNLKKCDFIF